MLGNYLSPQINFAARTPDEVTERAAEIIAAGDGFAYPAEFRARFDRSFAAQSGPFAAERIVRAADGAVRRRAGAGCRARAVAAGPRLHPPHPVAEAQPAADAGDRAGEIERRLQRFAEAMGRPQRFTIEPCGERVFHIHGHAERVQAEGSRRRGHLAAPLDAAAGGQRRRGRVSADPLNGPLDAGPINPRSDAGIPPCATKRGSLRRPRS